LDILGWIWWAISSAIGIVWSIVWFLLGGWVSALAQIIVIVGIIFFMKYGWQRAPMEMWTRANSAWRFIWAWISAREPGTAAPASKVQIKEVIRTVRVKEPGDVNLSTLLSLITIAGLCVLWSGS
jgi:hypothetical protein